MIEWLSMPDAFQHFSCWLLEIGMGYFFTAIQALKSQLALYPTFEFPVFQKLLEFCSLHCHVHHVRTSHSLKS